MIYLINRDASHKDLLFDNKKRPLSLYFNQTKQPS